MNNPFINRDQPKQVLQDMEVHDQWIGHFRSQENEPFYDLAFDYIARAFGSDRDRPVFDAGCGTGKKSIHLAKRGFAVVGLDISESVLQQAREAAAKEGMQAKIEFRLADLTRTDLPAANCQLMICWGVLMHVPDIEAAVAELCRLLAPSGTLVISEGNMWSLQGICLRFLKRLFGRRSTTINNTPAGVETWEDTSTGKFMTREANIPWLISQFERHGLALKTRRAGQFTELYVIVPWKPVRTLIHAINNAWFRWMGWCAAPCFGNLLVFERPRKSV
jgi:2-polyprenyl-3-methyl-5-hydroxy-6-metoxy-1,4-benzoquinol methylase